MKVQLAVITASLLHLAAFTQMNVDRRIELVGDNPGMRQVLGLPMDQAADAALSTSVEQAGAYRFAATVAQNAWDIEAPSLSTAPEAGTHLFLRVTGALEGNAQLSINSMGPFPIVIAPNILLDGSTIPEGTVLSLVFDGTNFHVMNGIVHAKRPCPDGMAQVSPQYCIEVDEREPESFFQAAVRCAEDGRRLCTWSEFYQGCVRQTSLQLVNMIGNHEWADTAMNEDGYARVVGRLSCTTAGGVNAVQGEHNYRCCYTR